MKNNKKLTVVHSNELVEASYQLSLDEMRMLNLALTKVDSRQSNLGRITLTPSEFADLYNLDRHNVYRNMRNAVKNINRKPIRMPYLDKKGKQRIRELSWLVELDYSVLDDDNEIFIQFSPTVEKYLFDLKEKFTSIDFDNVSKLNTPFSFRLYQWLTKAKHLDSAKKGQSITVLLEIDWIKVSAGLVGKYERWDVFKSKVIEPAVSQINNKTDISVCWKPVKKGRAVHAVEFAYVVEKGTLAKPIRPRLNRRPKVAKGSHEEGVWMRKNLALLLKYETELKEYDPAAKLDIKDLERIVEYSSICDSVTHQRTRKEIEARRSKRREKAA